jgi:hypothetical protein
VRKGFVLPLLLIPLIIIIISGSLFYLFQIKSKTPKTNISTTPSQNTVNTHNLSQSISTGNEIYLKTANEFLMAYKQKDYDKYLTLITAGLQKGYVSEKSAFLNDAAKYTDAVNIEQISLADASGPYSRGDNNSLGKEFTGKVNYTSPPHQDKVHITFVNVNGQNKISTFIFEGRAEVINSGKLDADLKTAQNSANMKLYKATKIPDRYKYDLTSLTLGTFENNNTQNLIVTLLYNNPSAQPDTHDNPRVSIGQSNYQTSYESLLAFDKSSYANSGEVVESPLNKGKGIYINRLGQSLEFIINGYLFNIGGDYSLSKNDLVDIANSLVPLD